VFVVESDSVDSKLDSPHAEALDKFEQKEQSQDEDGKNEKKETKEKEKKEKKDKKDKPKQPSASEVAAKNLVKSTKIDTTVLSGRKRRQDTVNSWATVMKEVCLGVLYGV
jgi:hypothetical protein